MIAASLYLIISLQRIRRQLYQFKFRPMGSQCKNISSYQLSKDFSVIEPQLHPAFGQILYLKSQSLHIQKAVKRISYLKQLQYQTLEAFRERIQLVRQCESVATLIKIYDYEVVEKYSEQAKVWTNIESKLNCQEIEHPFILLHFQYIPISHCLSSILEARAIALEKSQRKYCNEVTGKARSIKLNDYQSIDTLQSQERQIVNCFYQEIQILRMIDHLVGALYFLHHYGFAHGAVRPECVLVDNEGKYVLADRDLLMQTTNYQEGLRCVKEKTQSQEIFQFIAPEWLEELRLGKNSSVKVGQKSDIFCLGLLALRMCLLDTDERLFQFDPTSKTVQYHDQLVQKMLIQVKNKYSQDLTQLIRDMLRFKTEDRLDFAQLIDRLNSILLHNLNAIKLIYNPPHKQPSQKSSQMEISRPEHIPKFQIEERSILKQSLISMEEKFQKIMNNRSLLMHRAVNQKTLRDQQQKILSKLKQIQTTKTALRSTTAKKHNPEIATPPVANFHLTNHHSRAESPKDHVKQSGSQLKAAKRYMTGKELQAIVWKQYENLKSKRSPQ